MTEKKPKRPRGRPELPEGEGFTHYAYIRMSKEQWAKIERMAAYNGFKGRGKISATVRWMIERMDALTKGKNND